VDYLPLDEVSRMARALSMRTLAAALLLSACASTPPVPAEKPTVVQAAPADDFAIRKPDQIADSRTDKLGALRSVPVGAKTASEPGARSAAATAARH
jgi:hypothetical protein